MIGDTPYDAIAARDAGVVCLGLTCGGHDERALRRSGARAAWRDPADLLAHLDDGAADRVAGPGTSHAGAAGSARCVTRSTSRARGWTPARCRSAACWPAATATVVARAHNELNATKDKTAHAEMVTFAKAAGRVPPDARDLVLASTLEPCVMCTGAAMEAAVDTIVYALKAPADSGTGRVDPPESPESQMPRIVGDVLAEESRTLFEEWLGKPGNNPQQVAFVSNCWRGRRRRDRHDGTIPCMRTGPSAAC